MLQSVYLSDAFSTHEMLLLLSILLMAILLFALLCAESKTQNDDASAAAEVPAGSVVSSSAGAAAGPTENGYQSAQSRKKTLTSNKKTIKSNATRTQKRKQTRSSDKKARVASRKSCKPQQLMKLPPKSVIVCSENSDSQGVSGGGKSAIKESGGGALLSTGSYVHFEPRKTEKLDVSLDSVIPAPDEVPHY